MPDAHRAVGADASIEFRPGGKVVGVAQVSVGVEVFETAPVLKGDDATPVERGFNMEQAEFRRALQLGKHWRHGGGDAGPAAQGKNAVDAHADEEHNEGLIELRGVAAGKDGCHDGSLGQRPCSSRYFSASRAAIQPVPAAVMAWR